MSINEKYAIGGVDTEEYMLENERRIRWTHEKVAQMISGENVLDADQFNVLGHILGIQNYLDCDLNWEWNIDDKFDIITSFEVLEHLQNPLLYLREINRHLNDGGILILTTPVAWHHYFPIKLYKHHFKEYTMEELIDLFDMAGLRIGYMERFSGYTFRPLKYIGIRPWIRMLRDRIFGQHWFIMAQPVRRI